MFKIETPGRFYVLITDYTDVACGWKQSSEGVCDGNALVDFICSVKCSK